jgi:hypothetical protein
MKLLEELTEKEREDLIQEIASFHEDIDEFVRQKNPRVITKILGCIGVLIRCAKITDLSREDIHLLIDDGWDHRRGMDNIEKMTEIYEKLIRFFAKEGTSVKEITAVTLTMAAQGAIDMDLKKEDFIETATIAWERVEKGPL